MAAIVDASTFPLLPISPPIATLSGLAVTERDVFVCSWPKSGTTWMQAIVAHLVAPDRSAWSHVSEVTPFYDAAASWDGAAPAAHLRAAFAARGRRAWNTHVPWSFMPKGARYVYVVRDQRDALVSFWHHLRNQRGDAGTYEGAAPASGVSGESSREPGLCRGPRHASPARGGSEAVPRRLLAATRETSHRERFFRAAAPGAPPPLAAAASGGVPASGFAALDRARTPRAATRSRRWHPRTSRAKQRNAQARSPPSRPTPSRTRSPTAPGRRTCRAGVSAAVERTERARR
jgi:hypothetical protein